MSKAYCKLHGEISPPTTSSEMRKHCSRPGTTNDKGEIVYFTEQSHKKECDVNFIIQKYDKIGLLSHVSKIEAEFGDVTGLDFKTAQDLVINSSKMFNALPSNIRKRFQNDPMHLLAFMENPSNREEAISLGLIDSTSNPSSDGLGEHVIDGKVVTPPTPPEEPNKPPAS